MQLNKSVIEELGHDADNEPKSMLKPDVQEIFDMDKLKNMPNLSFNKVVTDKYARKEVVQKLAGEAIFENTDIKMLDFLLENCDRDIFQKLRSGEISAD